LADNLTGGIVRSKKCMVDSWTHMESTKCEPITGVCMGGARGGLSGVQEQSSFTGDEAPPPFLNS